MSEFIDRLANAAMKADWADEREAPPNAKIANYYTMVRAILTEMRDAVTPEMLQNIERELSSQNQCQRVALDAWQAAIDTALKEGQ